MGREYEPCTQGQPEHPSEGLQGKVSPGVGGQLALFQERLNLTVFISNRPHYTFKLCEA